MRRLSFAFILSVWVLFFPLLSYSVELLYPVGIADVEEITGAPFNINALRNVPMYIYMGDQDDNEPPAHIDRVEPGNSFVTKDFFGDTPIKRWQHAYQVYKYSGLDSIFKLYNGVGHIITEQMQNDVMNFFKHNIEHQVSISNSYQIVKISPSQSTFNFYSPYYLIIPENISFDNINILVAPNNSPLAKDDIHYHEEEAYKRLQLYTRHAMELSVPVLMPIFPRYYTHEHEYSVALLYLNWNSLKFDVEQYRRVDLQLIEMIQDARERLGSLGISTANKVLIDGYSASGSFANRFTLLHPELIQAAAIGAPGGFPILPVSHWPPRWDSEIGVINTQATQLQGTLRGFNSSGNQVWTRNVSLPGNGRLELDIAQAAGNAASNIKSMRFDITGGQAVGYQKFYQAGKYRVGLEALPQANQNALYLPHIHSDSDWWTGVGLVNTTSGAKSLDFSFSDGVTASRPLGASSHDSFTVETLRGSATFIGSAQVPNGAGVAGLMLFSSDRTLSGVSLSDATATSLVFPHVEQNGWWTGIGIYNPNGVPTELTIVGYDETGNQTDVLNETVTPFGNLVFPTSFSSTTAWFMVESTQPVTGFELFGTEDGNQLAGYSVVNLATTSGVFPKIERNGWTGIAFVNVGDGAATITLEARNDAGSVVASRNLALGARSKEVQVAGDLFPGQDINAATYVRFSSDQNVVGFQLNGSTDGTMLDGIPALGSTHVGSQRLYFPHIHAD